MNSLFDQLLQCERFSFLVSLSKVPDCFLVSRSSVGDY